MNIEMQQNGSYYVLLQFSHRREALGKPLLLAVMFSQNAAPEIMIRFDWQTQLHVWDREYLAELMYDWAMSPLGRVPALYCQLKRLSVGALTVKDIGAITPDTLTSVMHEVLGSLSVPG